MRRTLSEKAHRIRPASPDAATPAAATTPTAIPTLDDSSYAPALQKLLDQNNLTGSELRTILERGLLQDKVQTAIGEEQVPAVQPHVRARQILVPTSDQANDLLTQLQNGADFATLAHKQRWKIERSMFLAGGRQVKAFPNVTAEVAVFLFSASA